MRRIIRLALCGGALAIGAAAQPALAQEYKVNLRPLNESGVVGKGTLTLNADKTRLTVRIEARGLEPGQLHVAHIHGNVTGSNMPADSSIPSLQQDTDDDKFIELAEGLATYGPILVTLATDTGGNIDPDGDGNVDYRQTFDLTDPSIYGDMFNKMSLLGDGGALHLREIIVHGMSVPAVGVAPGEVDGTAGYKVVLPVAGGEIGTPGDPLRFRRPSGR
jgi:hypothetical protein